MLAAILLKTKDDRVPHPDQEKSDKGNSSPKLGLRLGIKSQNCMLVESLLMRFYQTTDLATSADSIVLSTTITNFKCQWEEIEQKACVGNLKHGILQC